MERQKKPLTMTQESPGRMIWIRFRRNKLALAGLLLIVASLVVALTCPFFLPDPSPDANRMCLPIRHQTPGFKVKMLLVRKQLPEQETSFLQRLCYGVPDGYETVPVQEDPVWEGGDVISYSPYTDGSLVLPRVQRSLAGAVWALDPKQPVSVSGGVIQAKGLNGESLEEKADVLWQQLMHKQVEERRFLLGTDQYGRDLLSRLLLGTRVTFLVGLVAVVISLLVGLLMGGLAGYFRGRTDQGVLWLINVVWSVPTLLLVIAITLVLGKGFAQVFIAVGLTLWVDVARIVRSQLFAIRELDFVSAGRTMGFTDARILWFHMLPNVAGPVLVVAASNFSTAILLEAGLSFLGIGAQPPTPSWGAMIKENYGFIILPESAYLALLPGIAIVLLTLSFTFVANGLRDAMDARRKMI